MNNDDRADARAKGAAGHGTPARGVTGLPPAHDLSDPVFPGRAGAWSGWVLAVAAALVLFSMMVITFIDVSGRKLFVKPLYGAYEVTEFLMGMLIFCALPLVTAREGHVTVDVFDQFVPVRWRRWQQAVITLVSAVTLGFIAWRLWLLGVQHVANREVTMTLHIPHGPFAQVFALMAGIAAVACLVQFVAYLRGTRDPRAAVQAAE